MNKRARNRLIGIAVILLIVIAAALVLFTQGAASNLTVAQAAKDSAENVGRRVQVTGMVVNGSWDKKTNPMTFKIRDQKDEDETGPQLTVVYSGALPATFGDGVEAIVTGEFGENDTITSAEMITKCPSKYATSDDAYTVSKLNERADQMVNIPVKVAGIIKDGSVAPPGGAIRFTLLNAEGATDEINVAYEGALSEDIKDGASVVLTGELDANGAFVATDVALEK
jgi:cytochrome c-type biogenesis protein CcmE